MARREIHELSYDELVLYKTQLESELDKVKKRLNEYYKLKFNTDLLTEISSQTSNEEE